LEIIKNILYKIIPVKTWIGFLNFFLIQWFFIRFLRNEKYQIIGILYFVLPLTGWWFSYYPQKFKTYTWSK